MINLDSIEDILKIAIDKEIESNVFYNLLSQYIQNPQIKELCIEFATEELEHKAKIELELMKLGKTLTPYSSYKNAPLKPLDYMVDMAKITQMDYKDLLLMAMQKEKASFRFYIELIPTVTSQSLRDTITELAEEEARHKISFEIEYNLFINDKKQTSE
jgi:rubrerythrin